MFNFVAGCLVGRRSRSVSALVVGVRWPVARGRCPATDCFWRSRVGARRACLFREPVLLSVGCSPPGPEAIAGPSSIGGGGWMSGRPRRPGCGFCRTWPLAGMFPAVSVGMGGRSSVDGVRGHRRPVSLRGASCSGRGRQVLWVGVGEGPVVGARVWPGECAVFNFVAGCLVGWRSRSVSSFSASVGRLRGGGGDDGLFLEVAGRGGPARFREPVSLSVGCSPPGPEAICQALVGRGRRVDVGEGPVAGLNAVGAVGGQPPKPAGAAAGGGGRRG